MANKYESYWKTFIPHIKRYLNSLYPKAFSRVTSKQQLKAIGGRKVSGHNFMVKTLNGKAFNDLKGSAPARGFNNVIVENAKINLLLRGRHVEFRHTNKYILEITLDEIPFALNQVPIAKGVFEGLVEKVNKAAIESVGPINDFQQTRSDKLGIGRRSSLVLFDRRSVFNDEYYAYNYGGRTELQFNLGRDHYGGKNIFRYGIAFSLNLSRWVYETSNFQPLYDRFNRFKKLHPEYFNDCQMWIWNTGGRTPAVSVKSLNSNNAGEGSFVFIGKYFDKDIPQITLEDVQQMVAEFNYLLPVYDFVQLNNETPIIPKIAKICWNKKGWQKPSGSDGKSKDPDAYERINGFGHEEWLFNYSRLIDDFHYAGLQPVTQTDGRYRGQHFDILLFTNNRNTGINYWVAEIKDVEILTEEQAKDVFNIYRKNNWLQTMENEVADEKGKVKAFRKAGHYLFNIRFKPENVFSFGGEPVEFKKDEFISHNRYTLLYRRPKQKLITDDVGSFEEGLSLSKSRKPSSSGSGRYQTEKFIQNRNTHKKIQVGFAEWLEAKHPNDYITLEGINKASRTKIDIVRKRKNGECIFYEVKSYDNVRHSIRMAIGQLLEYSFYPSQFLAVQIIIVTHKKAGPLDVLYIEHLNKTFPNFKVGYVYYNLDSKDAKQYVENGVEDISNL